MKKLMLLFVPFLFAFTYPEKPNTRVNDYAETLTTEQHDELVADLKKIQTDTGAQVAVAIFSTIEGESIENVANTLARKWKIGSKKSSDGVLFVIAMKERKVRIEVGYGLESTLTDGVTSSILRNKVRPYLKKGDVFGGTEAFAQGIYDTLMTANQSQPQTPTNQVSQPEQSGIPMGMLAALAGLLGLGALVYFLNRKREPYYATTAPHRQTMDTIERRYEKPAVVERREDDGDDFVNGVIVGSLLGRSSSGSSDSGGGWGSSDSGSSFGGGDSGFSGGGGDFGGGGSSDSF